MTKKMIFKLFVSKLFIIAVMLEIPCFSIQSQSSEKGNDFRFRNRFSSKNNLSNDFYHPFKLFDKKRLHITAKNVSVRSPSHGSVLKHKEYRRRGRSIIRKIIV